MKTENENWKQKLEIDIAISLLHCTLGGLFNNSYRLVS